MMVTNPITQKLELFDPFISFAILIFFKYIGNRYLFLPVTYFFHNIPWIFFSILGPLVFMGVALIYLILRNRPLSLKSYLIKIKYELEVVIAGIFLCWLVTLVEGMFLHGMQIDQFYLQFFDLPQPYYFFSFFTFFFLGPLFEETLFRGYIFDMLRRKWTLPIAIVVVMLFSFVAHMNFSRTVVALFSIIFQLIFTCAYLEGGLGASIVVHSFVNIYVFLSGV